MRKKYISSDFTKVNVYGTFNMKEEGTFMGGKMMDIEDYISIKNEDVIFYQNGDREQHDLNIESVLGSNIYSSYTNKEDNHRIYLDPSQSEYQKNKGTKWICEINSYDILQNHIFVLLKENRVFEGIYNNMTISNDIDLAINDYIYKNIIDRYTIDKIVFYTSYRNIVEDNIIKNTATFNLLEEVNNKVIITHNDKQSYIHFNQDNNGDKYSIEYYFDLYFRKI